MKPVNFKEMTIQYVIKHKKDYICVYLCRKFGDLEKRNLPLHTITNNRTKEPEVWKF